jgi:hypothetical protein
MQCSSLPRVGFPLACSPQPVAYSDLHLHRLLPPISPHLQYLPSPLEWCKIRQDLELTLHRPYPSNAVWLNSQQYSEI